MFESSPEENGPDGSNGGRHLTGDERAVFGQLTKGKSDAEIATHLGMTRSDIQRIHKSLSRKLGIAAQRLF